MSGVGAARGAPDATIALAGLSRLGRARDAVLRRLRGRCRGAELLRGDRLDSIELGREADELADELNDDGERRERRDAARPREVVDAELDDLEAAPLSADEQLDVDEGAFALDLDAVEHLLAAKLEREVRVAEAQAEEDAN